MWQMQNGATRQKVIQMMGGPGAKTNGEACFGAL